MTTTMAAHQLTLKQICTSPQASEKGRVSTDTQTRTTHHNGFARQLLLWPVACGMSHASYGGMEVQPNVDHHVSEHSQMSIAPPLVTAPAMPPRRCPPRIASEPCLALAGFLGGSSCRRSCEQGSRPRYDMSDIISKIMIQRGYTATACVVVMRTYHTAIVI